MVEAAGGPTLGELYYPLVALFQLGLVTLLLAPRRLDAVRVALALILGLNALESLQFWMLLRGGSLFPAGLWNFVVDNSIVLTVPFVLSQFPAPLGGPRGARTARWVWAAALAANALCFTVLATAEVPGLGPLRGWALIAFGPVPPAIALGILAAHTVPRTLGLAPGLLRWQSALVAAALGLGLAYSSVLLLSFYLDSLGLAAGDGYRLWLLPWGPVAFAFAAIAAVRAAAAWRARRQVDAAGLAAALAFGAAVAAMDRVLGASPLGLPFSNEFLASSFRPLLLALAVLRFDLFAIPAAVRRPLVAATAGVFGLSLFILLVMTLGGQGIGATQLDPVASLAALGLLLLGAVVLREPLGELLRWNAPGDPREAQARLEQYRLALEKARHEGAGDAPDLARLRRRLGLTHAQHEALVSVLDGNVVLPTAALVGAAPGALIAGRYEVVEELGRGGQGRALLARDRVEGGHVVLKEALRPWEEDAGARRAALQREADAAARVEAPQLARVRGLVSDPWQTYLVRDFVPGQTLEARVATGGPLRPEEAARVVGEVLQGLAALHAAGLLHLDVKPANVVVDEAGRAVLIDQGSARAVHGPGEATVTRGGGGTSQALTLRWAAPEQLRQGRLDARADVFQTGGLLYFALTGRGPAEGETPFDVEAAIRRGAPLAWPPRVPPALREVAEAARALDPAARFPDAAAMAAALAKVPAPRR